MLLFLFDLCRELGVLHPRMLPGLGFTWEDATDWLAAFELAPWGDGRDDQRQQVLISYLLHGTVGGELPALDWPYFDQDDAGQIRSGHEGRALEQFNQYRERWGWPPK